MTELSGGTRFLKPSDRGGKFRQAVAHGNKAITDRSATWGFAERADPLTIPPKVNASERFAQNKARGPLGGAQPGHRKRGRWRWYQGVAR